MLNLPDVEGLVVLGDGVAGTAGQGSVALHVGLPGDA